MEQHERRQLSIRFDFGLTPTAIWTVAITQSYSPTLNTYKREIAVHSKTFFPR